MPVFSGTASADRIVGGAEADKLYGLGGNDSLDGRDGDDWLVGGPGDDLMAGRLGNDFYDVDSAGDRVVEHAGEGVDRVRAWVSYQLTANVENLTLAGTADLAGIGNSLANTIIGNAGNNVLTGGAGDDTLAGGAGQDIYNVDSAGDRVIEHAGEGHDRVNSSVSYTLTANVEDLTLVGTGDLTGTGNSLANTIIGNAGSNILDGAAGDDTLAGSLGNDVYDVNSAGDRVVEHADEGRDRVNASISYALGANVEDLTLVGTGDLTGTGNSLANTVIGNKADNILRGGDGDDVLHGGDGNDQLVGGVGFDNMYGEYGNDIFYIREPEVESGEIYDGGDGHDELNIKGIEEVDIYNLEIENIENLVVDDYYDTTVNMSSNQINSFRLIFAWEIHIVDGGYINFENLVRAAIGSEIRLSNFGNVVDIGSVAVGVNGGDGNDTIRGAVHSIGGGGDDTLIAGSHNAMLDGGVGNDILRGGIGADSLYDGAGADDVNGGSGNDVLHVNDGYIVAGDRYDGGTGHDALYVGYEVDTPSVDISIAQITRFETLMTFTSLLFVQADQLDAFRSISASKIEVVSGGTIDFTGNLSVNSNMTLILSSDGNVVRAGSWGFQVQGGDGDDTVIGGSRRDFYTGGGGNDLLDGREADDSLSGGAGNDTLAGGAGTDSLQGGDGSDALIGGANGDSIWGGGGSDRFIFRSTLDGGDFINDFSSAEGDKLVFQNLLHGTFSYLGAAASTASGHSEARFGSGKVVVDVDGNGTIDIALHLTGITDASQLHASDFVFS